MIFPVLVLFQLMKKWLHCVEKMIGVYRWHPKIALRYLPVVKKFKAYLPHDSSILEAGSGGLGIAPYLKRRVIGLDIAFSSPISSQLIPVKASVLNIPFVQQSFDGVLSLDMLEHINPVNRERAITELVRITKKILCIGVPCGKLSAQQDEYLEKIFLQNHEKTDLYLQEQVMYGLPEATEIENMIRVAAAKMRRKIILEICGNLNLATRQWLMKGWISRNPLTNLIFRKVFLLLIPYLLCKNQEPTYRKLFFVYFHDE